MDGWINVKDRLPPVGVKCLWWSNDWLTTEIGYGSFHIDMIVENSLSDGGGVQCVKNYLHNYTHWMPLPKAPDNIQQRVKCNHSFSPVYQCVHCGKIGDSIA